MAGASQLWPGWRDGEAAAMSLERERAPFAVRPDAWFVLRLGQAVLVGLVEVDRGTERGERRWREKLEAYGALFAGGRLPIVTGYVNARVLVLTRTRGGGRHWRGCWRRRRGRAGRWRPW